MKEITLRIFDDADFGRLTGLLVGKEVWLVARDVARAMGFGAPKRALTDGSNSGLRIFENAEFGSVRMVLIDDQPWFVGKDVAEILGYRDSSDALKKHVGEADKGVGEIPTPGGVQKMITINESGVYSLIMGSKLPDAQRFKHWVTSEVLPAIMRHGEYQTPALVQQQEAVDQYVSEKNKKHLSRIELREGLTKGLNQQGANRDPEAYIAAKANGTLTARVEKAVDAMMKEFSTSGVTIINLDGVKELSLQAPTENAKAYLVWADGDVADTLHQAAAAQGESIKRLPEDQRKAIQQYANKLAGDEKRKATNTAKKQEDEWSGAQLLAALSHRIASRECNGDMQHGSNLVYKIISSALGIDFYERGMEWLAEHNKKETDKRPPRAWLIKPEEMGAAVQAIERHCGLLGVDISDILRKWYGDGDE